MGVEEIELEGWEYISKFNERLYIIVSNISNGVDISEEDYLFIEELYRVWDSGRITLLKTVCTDTPVTTTQANLFDSDNTSVT